MTILQYIMMRAKTNFVSVPFQTKRGSENVCVLAGGKKQRAMSFAALVN